MNNDFFNNLRSVGLQQTSMAPQKQPVQRTAVQASDLVGRINGLQNQMQNAVNNKDQILQAAIDSHPELQGDNMLARVFQNMQNQSGKTKTVKSLLGDVDSIIEKFKNDYESNKPENKDKNAVKYTYKKGDTFGQVIRNLQKEGKLPDTGNSLWGKDGEVAYYTQQLIDQGALDSRGNVIVGKEISLVPRS